VFETSSIKPLISVNPVNFNVLFALFNKRYNVCILKLQSSNRIKYHKLLTTTSKPKLIFTDQMYSILPKSDDQFINKNKTLIKQNLTILNTHYLGIMKPIISITECLS